MEGTYFTEACLDKADLTGANLLESNLFRATLREANCTHAKIVDAVLSRADFQHASLRGAILNKSQMVATDFSHADLTDTSIYGISVWDVKLDHAVQQNMRITDFEQPVILCDSLEIGQFLHLLLTNARLRGIIDSITSKVVLILGRFTPDCLPFLQLLRERLRTHNYVPVLFDFEKPVSRDLTETVSTIAHLARFVVADISQPRSVPQELMAFSRSLLSVAIQPLLRAGEEPYGMFSDFQRLQNFLPIHRYESASDFDLARLIQQVETRVQQLREL
jgi:hypothetical protein